MKKTKRLRIGEVNFNIQKPREVTYMKNEDLIDVYIYRYPVDEADKYLRLKLQKYGDLVQIQRINQKNTKIGTGTRCAKYRTITEEIPTTLFCRRMLIKTRYEGQDRQPICSRCKEKGHYRTECKKTEEMKNKKEERSEETQQKKETQKSSYIGPDREHMCSLYGTTQEIQKSSYIRPEREHLCLLSGRMRETDIKRTEEQEMRPKEEILPGKKKIEERKKIIPKKSEERRQNLSKKKEVQENIEKRRTEDEQEDMKKKMITIGSRRGEYPDYGDWRKHQADDVISYFQERQLQIMYGELREEWQTEQRHLQAKDPDGID